MNIFKRRNSLKNRLQSLEEYIGVVYVHKPDFSEHQPDSDEWGSTLVRRIKAVEEHAKENQKEENNA